MKSWKGFIFLWILFFSVLFLVTYFHKPGMTGYISFTGVLKEEPGQVFVSPEMNVSFKMEEKTIYKLRDITYSLHFVPNLDLKTNVNILYLVTDAEGKIVFSDEDNIIIQGETLINGNMDRRKAQEITLDEGEYVFSLMVKYGDSQETFSEKFNLEKISELLYSLKQLFDIKMEIDNKILDKSEDLNVRVVFESFGSEPTPVNLTFFIYDFQETEVYMEKSEVIVETERVLIKDFKNFHAGPGEYTVVLRTVYNVDVEDYFEQKINVKKKINFIPFVIGGIILISGIFLFLFKRKRK